MENNKNIRVLCISISSPLSEIGQMTKERARKEIKRMERQTGFKWVMDDSPYMYCEIGDGSINPCPLEKDYVWVVRQNEVVHEYWSKKEIEEKMEYPTNDYFDDCF